MIHTFHLACVGIDDQLLNLGLYHTGVLVGALTISIPYGYPAELRTDYVVMFLTSYGMEQDLHKNIS